MPPARTSKAAPAPAPTTPSPPAARPGRAGTAGPAAAALATAVAVLGTLIVLRLTAGGIGLSHDSAVYVHAARTLLDGGSMRMMGEPGAAMTHYPPLYPLLLALGGWIGVPVLDAARWLGALLFGANAVLAGLAAARCTGSLRAGACAAAAALSAVPLLQVHTMAWSEPVFLLLTTAGLLLLASYLQRPRPGVLLAAGAVAGLAFLARYPGVVLVGVGAGALLVRPAAPLRRRLWDAVRFGALGAAPVGVWIARNWLAAGSTTNRQLALHPVGPGQLRHGWTTLSDWAWPFWASPPGPLRQLSLLAAAAGVALVLVRRRRSPEPRRRPAASVPPLRLLPALLGAFAVAYVAFLLLSITLVDAATPLDYRLLSPLYPALLALSTWAVHRGATARVASAPTLLPVLAVVLAGGAAWKHLDAVAAWSRCCGTAHHTYARPAWRAGETLDAARRLPPEVVVYSNAPDAIDVLTGRPALWVPRRYDVTSLRENPEFASQMRELAARVARGTAAVVHFERGVHPHAARPGELLDVLAGTPCRPLSDGWIAVRGAPAGVVCGATPVPGQP